MERANTELTLRKQGAVSLKRLKSSTQNLKNQSREEFSSVCLVWLRLASDWAGRFHFHTVIAAPLRDPCAVGVVGRAGGTECTVGSVGSLQYLFLCLSHEISLAPSPGRGAMGGGVAGGVNCL